MYNTLTTILEDLMSSNPITNMEGHIYRISIVADYVINQKKGNLLEIGAGYGNTTLQLLKLSKKYNTKTIVIDPFESGWSYMSKGYGGYPFDIFKETIVDYQEYCIIHKENSQDPNILNIIETIDTKNICFAFVDGAQSQQEVLFDLNNMKKLNIDVIAVDDMNRGVDVSAAVYEFISDGSYKLIFLKGMREAYLIKI